MTIVWVFSVLVLLLLILNFMKADYYLRAHYLNSGMKYRGIFNVIFIENKALFSPQLFMLQPIPFINFSASALSGKALIYKKKGDKLLYVFWALSGLLVFVILVFGDRLDAIVNN